MVTALPSLYCHYIQEVKLSGGVFLSPLTSYFTGFAEAHTLRLWRTRSTLDQQMFAIGHFILILWYILVLVFTVNSVLVFIINVPLQFVSDLPRPRRRLTELLYTTAVKPAEKYTKIWADATREWHLKFLRSPTEIIPSSDGQRPEGVKFTINTLQVKGITPLWF